MTQHLHIPTLVAYLERESMDPVSGEAGILRKEWRVDPVSAWAEDDLILAWSDRWRRYKPEAAVVLAVRYIRRGVEKPWRPFEPANTFKQALEYIDSGAVACCPELQELQEIQRNAKLEAERKAEEQRLLEMQQAKRIRRANRSNAAFIRLRDGKDGIWANRWNDMVKAVYNNPKLRERLLAFEDFKQLHAAVIDATTVPSKRKAIKICLAWLDGYVDMETGELK